jgi:hypothetical protein
VFATIDNFAGYSKDTQSIHAIGRLFADTASLDNLALFFSGNEVINARNNTNAAPYIKAVTRVSFPFK